jgi:hypothetical protein
MVDVLSGPTGEPARRRRYGAGGFTVQASVTHARQKQQTVVAAMSRTADNDKRAFARSQVRKNGKVLFVDQPCFVECIIRNISEDGALLALLVSVPLPSEVLLWEQRTGALYECDVRWRKEHMVGVHFVDVCGRATRRALLDKGIALVSSGAASGTSVH